MKTLKSIDLRTLKPHKLTTAFSTNQGQSSSSLSLSKPSQHTLTPPSTPEPPNTPPITQLSLQESILSSQWHFIKHVSPNLTPTLVSTVLYNLRANTDLILKFIGQIEPHRLNIQYHCFAIAIISCLPSPKQALQLIKNVITFRVLTVRNSKHIFAMEGGWIPVLRDKGRSGPWRSREGAGIFTVFVDNLPVSLNPKGLFNLFTKLGVVNDIFIPQKRRRATNTRFGFVRFDCFVAAKVAVQKANGLWVDDRSLQVKHADFAKAKVGVEAARTVSNAQGRRQVAQVNDGEGGRVGAKGFRDQRSYVEAVAGERAKGLGGLVCYVPLSLVGE